MVAGRVAGFAVVTVGVAAGTGALAAVVVGGELIAVVVGVIVDEVVTGDVAGGELELVDLLGEVPEATGPGWAGMVAVADERVWPVPPQAASTNTIAIRAGPG